jgi:DnaK suppressor protein
MIQERQCNDELSQMSDDFAAEMRARLLELREELESLAATSDQSSGVVELDQTRVGRLSRMDALQAQAMAKASGRRREVTLQNISRALARIDSGEYGLCHRCDEPIHRKRLEFDPAAQLCIQCAERAERSD